MPGFPVINFAKQRKPSSGAMIDLGHPLASGLVGMWTFCEGSGLWLVDHVAKYKSLLSGSPIWTGGNFGSSVQFNGTTTKASAGNVLDFSTGSFSFGIWWRASTTQAGFPFNKRFSSTSPGYEFLSGADGVAGRIRARVSDGSTTINIANWEGTNDGKFHLAVAVVDRNNSRCWQYGDGTYFVGSASIGTLGNVSNALPLAFGCRDAEVSPNAFFTGQVSGAFVYNRALNSNEVSQLYVEPFSMFLPTGPLRFYSFPASISSVVCPEIYHIHVDHNATRVGCSVVRV